MSLKPSYQLKVLRLISLVAVALSLSACGFHLRGNIPLSDGIKNMYLSAPEGAFKDLLQERLEYLGATFTQAPEAADVVLNVDKASTSRTVGTLDEFGKVNSYNIRFTVNYTLLDSAEKPIRPSKRLLESRRYNFNAENVIQSESEEAILVEDMEQEMVLKIIRQLASITDFDPNEVNKQPLEQKASDQ